MLALDFVVPISSTSLPGGNLVDGLPPAASMNNSNNSFASRSSRLLRNVKEFAYTKQQLSTKPG